MRKLVKPDKLGDTRVREWFAILPVWLGRDEDDLSECRWLERVKVKQVYSRVLNKFNNYIDDWKNHRFV